MSDQFGKYDTNIDPCPTCQVPVDAIESRPEYARSNPEAVATIRDPNCPRDTDPDAECTCQAVINPAPNPAYDQYITVATWVTLKPCGHAFEAKELESAGWEVTQTVKPGWHQRKLDQLVADAHDHGIELIWPG